MCHTRFTVVKMVAILSLGWITANPSIGRAGQIVFDNLRGASVPSFGPSCCQTGDEISLSGSARSITLLTLGVYTQGFDLNAGIEMAIYANDGPGTSPGSLLWQSGPLAVFVPAATTEINFLVPGIIVPDVITVTSLVSSSDPVALGRLLPAPPTTGSLNNVWYEASPGTWASVAPAFASAVRVEAVPESPSNALLLAGLAGIAFLAFVRRSCTARRKAVAGFLGRLA